MILKFHGIVTLGDASRSGADEKYGAIYIGDQDVVGVIEETKFKNSVTMAVADKRFSGDLDVDLGWGYSEYTPMDDDKLTVGPHNIIEILGRYDEQTVTLWIADEPINTLANTEGGDD